jgi:hypothetical protein
LTKLELNVSVLFTVLVTIVIVFPAPSIEGVEIRFGLLRLAFGSTLPDWTYVILSWVAWLFAAVSTTILGWIHLTELAHRRHRLAYFNREICGLNESIGRQYANLAVAGGSGNALEARVILETIDRLEKRKAEIENQVWKL